MTVQVPVISMELQPGGISLFLLFRRIGLGGVHGRSFAQRKESQEKRKRSQRGEATTVTCFLLFLLS